MRFCLSYSSGVREEIGVANSFIPVVASAFTALLDGLSAFCSLVAKSTGSKSLVNITSALSENESLPRASAASS